MNQRRATLAACVMTVQPLTLSSMKRMVILIETFCRCQIDMCV